MKLNTGKRRKRTAQSQEIEDSTKSNFAQLGELNF